jgi:hypothetical protein
MVDLLVALVLSVVTTLLPGCAAVEPGSSARDAAPVSAASAAAEDRVGDIPIAARSAPSWAPEQAVRPSSDLCKDCRSLPASLKFLCEGSADEWCGFYSTAEIVESIEELTAEYQRGKDTLLPWPQPGLTVMNFFHVVGDHVVTVVRLECTCGCEALTCRAFKSSAVFDTDPAESFALDGDVDANVGLHAVRLYRRGKLVWDGQSDRHGGGGSDATAVSSVGVKDGKLYLDLHSTACNWRYYVSFEGQGEGERLRMVEDPTAGGCS